MFISKSSSLPILLTPASSSSSSNSLSSSSSNTRPNSHPSRSNSSRISSWHSQSVESVVAISDTVAGADFAHYHGVDSRSTLMSTGVPSIYSLQGSEQALVSSSVSMTSRMFSRPSGQRGQRGAKTGGTVPRVDVAPRTPKSTGPIDELPNLHKG
ncbi:hypothetical protein BGZ92_006668, partial [Podila epicladia]